MTLGACAVLAVSAVLTGTQAEASAPSRPDSQSRSAPWQPEPASYGVSQPVDIPVRMDDGVVISTEVVYPTDPATGARAAGTFPVLLTQNPYGTARSTRPRPGTTSSSAATSTSPPPCAAPAPPAARCPGSGQRQGEDGAELVNWAAHSLSGSDGKVGLDGCSYLGVDQWFTAAAVGPDSALKAITPFCTDSNFYDDLTADGGSPPRSSPGSRRANRAGPRTTPPPTRSRSRSRRRPTAARDPTTTATGSRWTYSSSCGRSWPTGSPP